MAVAVWKPGFVAVRRALGVALYRLPGSVRSAVPVSLRDSVRHRIGPFAPWEAGYAHEPPEPADGEVVLPPDFVGVGVQKSGTTWWFELIVSHPEVFHRPEIHKERHFFARFARDRFGPEEIRAYHAWFPRPEGFLSGEWTPDYFDQPWVPALLAAAAPEARLLVIVRDPLERFVSGLAHSDMTPASNLGAVMSEAFGRGLYSESIRRWRDHFGAGRMLFLQYERCVADPLGEIARTYRFLGLDDSFRPATVERAQNRTVRRKAELDPSARRRLIDLYSQDVKETVALLPELDVELWPNFAGR